MFTDSHCHLEDETALPAAFNAGVTTILNAGKDLDEADFDLALAEKYDNIYTSAGIYPINAPEKLETITTQTILQALKHPKVIAVGECGLDYHYGADIKEAQKEMFARHVEAAGISGLPLMIHEREAEDDMLELLYAGVKKFGSLKGVIHCFTSTKEFADAVLELGFYLSASGIITFKTAGHVAEMFKNCPEDKILIETDSPYLAPVPYRGKPNEPAYVVKTAEFLAALRGWSLEKTAEITTKNFYNLYQKATRKV